MIAVSAVSAVPVWWDKCWISHLSYLQCSYVAAPQAMSTAPIYSGERLVANEIVLSQ